MEYGLIGEHLGHSFSKEIHGMIADYHYELKELAPEEVDSFIEAREFKAINVTIPYKQKVIPLLDWISEDAKAIGAVNTVVNRDGKLYGYNTDFMGMCACMRHKGLILEGKKVLILGTGGTSKTALAAAKSMGASRITRASRSGNEDAITYEKAMTELIDTEIIINTTPVGMFPNSGKTAIDISFFPNLEGIMDVIYNPLRTELCIQGENRGIPATGGLYMLVGQAVYAYGYFFDKEVDIGIIDPIYNKILRDKQNIVLIGMSGSGKSVIGKQLAMATGRELIDTDAEIIRKIGTDIPEIFESVGEAGFRAIEHDVVLEAAAKNCCIISTGGGAVLDPNNVKALHGNGIIYYIDRDPEQVEVSYDRPLARNRDAAIALYKKRYDIYIAAADITIDNSGSVEDAVNAVLEKF